MSLKIIRHDDNALASVGFVALTLSACAMLTSM